MKVLIVEDTPGDLTHLRALLGAKDCRVVEARDGWETLAKLEAKVAELERTDADLRRLNRELESRVRQRTQELEASHIGLETFSNSVAHDLRAPLRHISGYANLTLQSGTAQLDEGNLRNLHRIRESAEEMGGILEGLLELNRVSYSEIHQRQIDLSALACRVGEELRRSVPERRVQIQVAPGLTVRGDQRLLRVALMNLLGNALKFTSKRTEARIEFGRMDSKIARPFFVRDNGAGFDMAHVGKLFAAFQRLHNRVDFDGRGIGLATVQRIVQRHNGKTWAEGAPNQGATFYFTLGETSSEVVAASPPEKQQAA